MLHKKKSSLVAASTFLMVLFLLNVGVFAQETKNVIVSLNNQSISNLKNAIQSDNPGLRKSGIYFAGKYAVDEVSETLLHQLKKEEDPNLRVLMIRVLYIIGNYEYMDEIYQLAQNDKSIAVRQMAASIYDVMKSERSINLAEVNN
jgi:HEAT repeat protein